MVQHDLLDVNELLNDGLNLVIACGYGLLESPKATDLGGIAEAKIQGKKSTLGIRPRWAKKKKLNGSLKVSVRRDSLADAILHGGEAAVIGRR